MLGEILSADIEIAMLSVAGILSVIVMVPAFCKWMGWERYRNRAVGGPSEIESENKNACWHELANELKAIGFRPLSVHEEGLDPWFKTFREDVFVAPNQQCFATLYSLFGEDWEVSFASVMDDDSLVQTLCDAGEEHDTDDCIVRRIADAPLADLFEAQMESIDRFKAQGRALKSHKTIDQATQVQWHIFHNPTRYAEYKAAMKTMFMAKGTTLMCLPGPMLLSWPFFGGHQMISELFLLGSAGWLIATSLFFLGIDVIWRLAKSRPLESEEIDAELEQPASPAGRLIYNHWIWLGLVMGFGWKLGGAGSMVQTVLATVGVLVVIEFVCMLLRIRGRFQPQESIVGTD